MNEIAIPDPQEVAGHGGWSAADFTISNETADQLEAAQSANTRDAYTRNWKDFAAWCAENGRVPLPATPHTLLEYIRIRIDGTWAPPRETPVPPTPAAPATISQIIGTIRTEHRQNGYKGQPDTEETLKLLKAYRHAWADTGHRVRKATPILVDTMQDLIETCDTSKLAGMRDRCILLLGFYIMRRASEIARLDIRDLRWIGEDGIDVYIRYSKTDQEARGDEINVPYGQHAETCPVRTTRAWVEALAEHGITEGPLFRRICRHGFVADEYHGCGTGVGGALTPHSITAIIRKHAERAQLPGLELYSGHSLRSGAATTAYAAGAPPSAIAAQGGWSEKSPVMLGYIRAVDKRKNNPMKGIGL